MQTLLESGLIRTSAGAPVTRASLRVKAGESYLVTVPPPEPAVPQAEDLPLEVLFEDKDLLVVNKPAGLVVHPGAGHRNGTLVNALLHHVKDLAGVGGVLRPGLVHRLDKDTSGVLVVAKHDRSLVGLQAAFKARDVEKTYLALVHGLAPDEGTFSTLYGRHPTQRMRFTGRVREGKNAVTHFKTVKRFATATELEVQLETGRTHQIRVHLSEAKLPLLGDTLYGTKASLRPDVISRQALHAYRLAFEHPRTGKALTFEAKVPQDFVDARRRLKAR